MSTTIFCDKQELQTELTPMIEDCFHVSSLIAADLVKGLQIHIDRLRDDVNFVIEYPYVDRVYRDSYL